MAEDNGITPYAAQAAQAVQDAVIWNDREVSVLKEQIAPDISDEQLALFGMICQQTGLSPFARQIYAVMRNSRTQDDDGKWRTVKKMTVQTGIDGYRLTAARTGELAGIDDAVYDTDEAIVLPNKASVTVWRFVHGQRVPFTATARWREYAVYKDEYENGKKTGKQVPSDMWARMPYLMLGKCAEALALRKAFPAELSGVYTREEMNQASQDSTESDGYVDAQSSLGDVWATSNAAYTGAYEVLHDRAVRLGVSDKRWREAKAKFKGDTVGIEAWLTKIEASKRPNPLAALRNRAFQLGYTTQEQFETLVISIVPESDGNEPTTDQIAVINAALDQLEAAAADEHDLSKMGTVRP